MEFSKEFSKPVTQLSKNIFYYNLKKIVNVKKSLIERIPPNSSGIYAWFRNFDTIETDEINFYNGLLNEIGKPHMLKREGRISPLYNLSLSSDIRISTKKKESLVKYCKNKEFIELIRETLQLSIFFQPPLYIGKTNNFRNRISEHLNGKTSLKDNLVESEINILHCKLILVKSEKIVNEKNDTVDSDIVFEDIMSRLFQPGFGIKYG